MGHHNHVHLDGLCHWEIDMVEAVNAWKHLGTKNLLSENYIDLMMLEHGKIKYFPYVSAFILYAV